MVTRRTMLSNLVKHSVLVVAALIVVCGTSTTRAEEWGSIKGRILLDGTAPKLAPIAVTKDQYCMDKKPANDTVVVGKDNALVNAVVYLRVAAGSPKVAVNPEYEAKLSEPV